MVRSVRSTERMEHGSGTVWKRGLDKGNHNSNENISSSNENVGPVIRILEIEAKIDKEPTQVDESSAAVLKYRTPNFRYKTSSLVFNFLFKFNNLFTFYVNEVDRQ